MEKTIMKALDEMDRQFYVFIHDRLDNKDKVKAVEIWDNFYMMIEKIAKKED